MDRRGFVAAVFAAAVAPIGAHAQDSDAERERYIGSILVIAGVMTWFFDESTRLTTNVQPETLLDETWRVDVLAPFSIPRAVALQLDAIQPPADFAATHDLLAQAVDAAIESGDAMKLGVLNVDSASILVAAEHLGRATDLINQATAALPTG